MCSRSPKQQQNYFPRLVLRPVSSIFQGAYQSTGLKGIDVVLTIKTSY